MRHGGGPGGFDERGAREAIINRDEGLYYLFYDGASSKGWVVNLATSTDLEHWDKHGPLFEVGPRGTPDRFVVSPWVIKEGEWWHMFYIGEDGGEFPEFPYLTFKARSRSLAGPWVKQPEVVPFTTKPDTYYSITASAGHIMRRGDEYLQYISTTTRRPEHPYVLRTLGLARTQDLNGPWTLDPEPILPIWEQVENTSLYYEPANGLWFLFTNHIGLEPGTEEYTDAIWVYWSPDPTRWDAANKAIVLDGETCSWSSRCIGMPTVIAVEGRLAVFYDAPGGDSISHWDRHIGLAWLDLPLRVPGA